MVSDVIPTGTGLWQGIDQIGLVFDNWQKDGASSAVIYANGRHEVAARVVIHMTDKDGNKLLPEEYPALDKVKDAVRFIDYKNEVNIDGKEYGWTAEQKGGSFVEPLMGNGTQPPMDAQDDNITDSIATLTYFLSCSPDAAQKDFHLGLMIEFKTEDGLQIRAPIYVSEKGEFQIPDIELAAVNQIVITPDLLMWDADEVTNNDQDDSPDLSGANKPGNLWRQINYAISLNIHNTQPHYKQSILYRAGLSERTHYRPATDTQSQYCFGEVRQGLYSFRGYLWPNNVYAEADVLNPAAKAIGNSSSYSLNATGFSGQTCELKLQEGEIYVTLFCSYGWTANLAYDKWPIEITVYDQFGNSGEFLVDPDELPTAYAADGSLEDQRYFTTEKYKKATHGGVKEVYFKLFDPYNSKKITYTKNESDVTVSMAPEDATHDQMFRLFRAAAEQDCAKQTYKITTHDYQDVSLSPSGSLVKTASTMVASHIGWTFLPYWEKTSQVIFNSTKKVFMQAGEDNSVQLAGEYWVDDPDEIAWDVQMVTDASGNPDDGSGGNENPYNFGKTVERGSWVRVTDLKWEHAVTSNNEAMIFSNGNHQDQINITMTLADVNGVRLVDINSPTIDYVKNAVTVIDYMTGEHLSRHETATGWEFSYVKNEYDGALASVTIDFTPVNVATIQDGVVQFTLYVTSKSGRSETRQLGLAINITDKAWGDSVTWLNKNGADFQKPLAIKSLLPIIYSKKQLDITAREVSYPGQNDEGFASNSNINNYIRQWDYEVSIKPNLGSSYSTKMFKCIVDCEKYPFPAHNLDKLNNIFLYTYESSQATTPIAYGLQSWGAYAFLGFFWPMNILNKNEKPFNVQVKTLQAAIRSYSDDPKASKLINFDLSYPAPRADSLYFTVLGIFGAYQYFFLGQSRNPINFTLYDNYGNSGQFHARPEALPTSYDRHDMAAWCPVADGFYRNPIPTESYTEGNLQIIDTIKSWPLSMGGPVDDKKVAPKKYRYCILSNKYPAVSFHCYTHVGGENWDWVVIYSSAGTYVILAPNNDLAESDTTFVYLRPIWARQKVLLSYIGGDKFLRTRSERAEKDGYADLVLGDYSLGDEDFEFSANVE